jgi:hypothetical protein
MSIDDLLLVIIIAGIGLSGAYLRAEMDFHRRMMAAQRDREIQHLELHTKRLRHGHDVCPRNRALFSRRFKQVISR